MNYGLKLWSTNVNQYTNDIKEMYHKKIFSYIELYAVTNSSYALDYWKQFDIPFVIHANESSLPFDICDIFYFALELKAEYIVFHPFDTNEEGREYKLNLMRDFSKYYEKKVLIENVPAVSANGEKIVSYNIDEMKNFIEKKRFRFLYGFRSCYLLRE